MAVLHGSFPWSPHWLSRWQVQVVMGQGIYEGSQWPSSTCCLKSGHTPVEIQGHKLPGGTVPSLLRRASARPQICIQISHLPRGPAPRGCEASGPPSEAGAASPAGMPKLCRACHLGPKPPPLELVLVSSLQRTARTLLPLGQRDLAAVNPH